MEKASPALEYVRIIQARRLYHLKFGDVLGCASFERYLEAKGKDSLEPVPQLPVWPVTHLRLFGAGNAWLVDGRVADKVGLKEYCRLAGLVCHENDDLFAPFDQKRAKSGIRWMIGQDGYRNQNRTAVDCRKTFAAFEVGMDAIEGVALYAQDPGVIDDHFLDLPGSVHRERRDVVASFGIVNDSPRLDWNWEDVSQTQNGSASRGE